MLEHLVRDIYSKPLSRNFQRRCRREWKIMQSIRRLLRDRSDIVIRRTD